MTPEEYHEKLQRVCETLGDAAETLCIALIETVERSGIANAFENINAALQKLKSEDIPESKTEKEARKSLRSLYRRKS
jgi:hypothetical protein